MTWSLTNKENGFKKKIPGRNDFTGEFSWTAKNKLKPVLVTICPNTERGEHFQGIYEDNVTLILKPDNTHKKLQANVPHKQAFLTKTRKTIQRNLQWPYAMAHCNLCVRCEHTTFEYYCYTSFIINKNVGKIHRIIAIGA